MTEPTDLPLELEQQFDTVRRTLRTLTPEKTPGDEAIDVIQFEMRSLLLQYTQLAAAVDGYAQCRGTEAERINARVQVWHVRNQQKQRRGGK